MNFIEIYCTASRTRLRRSHNMSQPNVMSQHTTTSDSILPGITLTTAIPAIYANDGIVNIAGRDQIFNNVDPNQDRGIWTNHPATQTHQSSRQNLPVVVRCHPIYELSRSSRCSLGR